MTVGELIMRLQRVDPTLTVSITDGWTGAIYEGSFPIRIVTLAKMSKYLILGLAGINWRKSDETKICTKT